MRILTSVACLGDTTQIQEQTLACDSRAVLTVNWADTSMAIVMNSSRGGDRNIPGCWVCRMAVWVGV